MNRTFETRISRHSKASYGDRGKEPEDRKGRGLTQEGVELARSRAMEELLPAFEQMPENGVMVMMGASFRPRTKETLRVYGETLRQQVPSQNVIDEAWWNDDARKEKGVHAKIQEIQEIMNMHPQDKFLVILPVALNVFFNPQWIAERNGKRDVKGEVDNWNEEYTDWLKRYYEDPVEGYLKNVSTISSVVDPNAQDDAEGYLNGIERLQQFLQAHIPAGRPVVNVINGHSWALDAVIDAVAHEGVVTGEGFAERGGVIQETEMVRIKIEDGKITLRFRGKEYTHSTP